MKERLIRMAREAGFPAVAFAGLAPVVQEGVLHPQAAALSGDPAALMADAGCVMLLAMPYRPFREIPGEAQVDAYYLTSNAAHEAVQRLAREIGDSLSLRALPSPPLYLKPLAVRSGLGEFGRNGLISVGEYGTRVALQSILLNARVETRDRMERALSPQCEGCRRCLAACPVGALCGDGRVDIARCLRAQPESEPFPEAARPHLGGSLLGCDLCQRACPRNRLVAPVEPPAALREALSLEALLRGNWRPLVPFLGSNNARRQRLTARALLAAANLKRNDLVPLIRPLAEGDGPPAVTEHARWALARLAAEEKDAPS